MTLHSAKGLEFPKVFMVGMEDGIFPSHMTISYGDDGDGRREKTLLRGKLTRAMKTLLDLRPAEDDPWRDSV